MKGWISLHRGITKNWTWEDKPFSKGQAWIDILLMVNHEDKKILFDNELLTVERGSRITSIRKLCNRWGWSNSKVRAFLALLEQDEMMAYKSDTRKTVLTVVNYNDYQSEEKRKTPLKHHSSTTETPLKHTNNNDNNDNNDNKKKSKAFSPSSIEYVLTEKLAETIKHNIEYAKIPENLNKWVIHIDRLIRIDKAKIEDIEVVIEFLKGHDFWGTNIQSTSKFREKFPTLHAQLNRKPKQKKPKDMFSDIDSRTSKYTAEELDKIARRKFKDKYGG